MITQKVIDRLLKEQRGCCQNCGCDLCNIGYEIHHAIYSRDIRFVKYLDQSENLVALCPRCHRRNHGWLTNIEQRKKFWKWKIERGYDMQKWADEIPMIIKDRFDA